MNCSRCRGLMVEDHFLDFDGTIGHMWTTGYRCMNCGSTSGCSRSGVGGRTQRRRRATRA